MIDFDDLTEKELAFRGMLRAHAAQRAEEWHARSGEYPTEFTRWARKVRIAWSRTAEGKRAIAECEGRRGKRRRRVDLGA